MGEVDAGGISDLKFQISDLKITQSGRISDIKFEI